MFLYLRVSYVSNQKFVLTKVHFLMRYEAISATHNFVFLKMFWLKTTVNPYQKKTSKIAEITFLVKNNCKSLPKNPLT